MGLPTTCNVGVDLDTIKLLFHFIVSDGPWAMQTLRAKNNKAMAVNLFIGFINWFGDIIKNPVIINLLEF